MPSTTLPRRAALLAGLGALAAHPAMAQQEAPSVRLFRLVTARDEIIAGLTPSALAELGPGPEVERIARRLVAEGQLTLWRYTVGRAPDGGTRLAPSARIAVLRQDTLRIEPYQPALPVAPLPPE